MEKIEDTIQGGIALLFVESLAKGKYLQSHQILSMKLKQELPQLKLKEKYENMINYVDSPLDSIAVLNNWKFQGENDLGWVYVALCFDNEVEAITVAVTKEVDKYVISDIEWGRP